MLCCELKLNQDLQYILIYISQSPTKISTKYLPITVLNYFFWKHVLYFIILILFVYQMVLLLPPMIKN